MIVYYIDGEKEFESFSVDDYKIRQGFLEIMTRRSGSYIIPTHTIAYIDNDHVIKGSNHHE